MTHLSSVRPQDLLQVPPSANSRNWSNGSTNSAQEQAQEQRISARLEAAGKVLALFYMAWDREAPGPKAKAALAATWAEALQKIPVNQILRVAQEELAERESAFFPVPADLIKRWNSSRRMTPEGSTNGDCYEPYVPSRLPALPAPLPPLQIDPQELKRRLGTPVIPPIIERKKETVSPLAPTLSTQWSGMLQSVADAGNIALERCTSYQITELRAFGNWWLANHPDDDLEKYGFSAGYSQFCEARTLKDAA